MPASSCVCTGRTACTKSAWAWPTRLGCRPLPQLDRVEQGSKGLPSPTSDWSAFKSPFDLLGIRIATTPLALKRPEAYGMVFADNFHRPIDGVDMVRKVLPQVKEIK